MRDLRLLVVVAGMAGLLMAGCAGKTWDPACKAEAPAESSKAVAAPTAAEDEKAFPFAVVGPVAVAPTIDGVIESAWGKPIGGAFVDTVTGQAVDWPTEVWLAYDETTLYVAMKLVEPDMDDVVAYEEDRDGDVWEDDAMEIFLDPTNTHSEDVYYHIMVNALGTIADRQGANDSIGADYAWDAEGIEAVAKKGEGFWAVELTIPLKSMGVKDCLAGAHWAANFCRTRFGNDMEAVWSQTGPETFHAPEQFGHIAFR